MRVVQAMLSGGSRRELKGGLKHLSELLGASIAIGIIYAVGIAAADLFAVSLVFLCAILPLVFLTFSAGLREVSDRPGWIDFALAAISVAVGIHFYLNQDTILTRISLMDPLTPVDIAAGTALLVLTVEATRRTVGLALVLVVLAFALYNLFGDLLPGVWGHGPISYVEFLDVMVMTPDGIFGVPLRAAAGYAFLFVLFGTFLASTGGGDFFFKLGAAIAGRQIGGPAKIAVVSSGLYGMASGSPTADVVTTGSITIPMMKRMGFPAPVAGGIEVAASTGGSLMPPVMGSVAFVMSVHTGIPYGEIALAALLPALLYYFAIFLQVHLRAQKYALPRPIGDDIPTLRQAMAEGGIFLVPLAVLVGALTMGFSASLVAMSGLVAVIVVAMANPRTRFGFRLLYELLHTTTLRMVGVAGACAAAGLVIGGLGMTGLGIKFSHLVLMITGDALLPALLVTAVVCILLGMGMPTSGVYILCAVLLAPTLQQLGLSVIASNMFILFFAIMSAMTPPVAIAAFAAAPLANANPLHIGASAVRFVIAAMIIPFTFIYGDELLLRGDVLAIVLAVASAIPGVALVAIAVEGYLGGELTWLTRLLLAGAGISLMIPSLDHLAVGLALCAVAGATSPALRAWTMMAWAPTRPGPK